MYIDIYTHIFPNEFYENMTRVAPSLGNIGKRMKSVAEVHDLDARFRSVRPVRLQRAIDEPLCLAGGLRTVAELDHRQRRLLTTR